MERVYLQWNLENWITVLLMGGLGMAIVGLVSSGIKQWRNSFPSLDGVG